MSESEQSARPRQLTMAGGFVIAGSLILLFTVFDTITNLHSVETRDAVSKMLSSQTGEGLGLTVSEALSGMRFGLMVTAVCAAASAVLGVFVLQRHRGARVALSVLAVPILITSPLTGGLLGALVAVSTLALWSGPARDWFAGRPVRQPAVPERSPESPSEKGPGSPPPWPPPASPPSANPPTDPPANTPAASSGPWQSTGPAATQVPPASELSTEQPSSQPAATTDFGQRPAHQDPSAISQPWAAPPGGYAAWPQQAPAGVPAPVKVACLLTWVFAGTVALMYAVVMVALVVAKDNLVDYVVRSPEWQRADFDPDLILPVLWLGCLMFFAWAVGALVLAWFTWRRHNWARFLLAGSAGVALVAALFAFPVGILHQLAGALTIAFLFSVRSRAWFARPTRGPGPPYGPPPGQYGPPPGQQGPPPGQQGPPPGQQGPPPGQQGQGRPPVW